MSVGFVLLALSAAFDILADKGSEAWPPELCGNIQVWCTGVNHQWEHRHGPCR